MATYASFLRTEGVDNSTVELSSKQLQLKDGGIATAKIADSGVTFAKLNNDVLQYAEKSFSAAQIKTLYSANTNKGLEIVAAPGASKVIEFISAVLFYDYDGSNAYTAANGIKFNLGTTAVSDTLAGAAFLQATDDVYRVCQALSADVALAANTALYLQEGTTNPTGSATATDQLIVKCVYRVHDFS